jgi:hypothetical protein
MNGLIEDIESLRFANKNYEGRFFVPEAKLFSLMSETVIRVCLEELSLPAYQHEEIVTNIVKGARRCFAILLLTTCGGSIVRFFGGDSLQRSRPDDRLPFDPHPLARIFGVQPDDLKVRRFIEKQWDFAIPVFSQQLLTRELEQRIILPYIMEEPLGEGAFGTAYRTMIHPQSHELPLKENRVSSQLLE